MPLPTGACLPVLHGRLLCTDQRYSGDAEGWTRPAGRAVSCFQLFVAERLCTLNNICYLPLAGLRLFPGVDVSVLVDCAHIEVLTDRGEGAITK